MNPFFFGAGSRRLFGIYTPPLATGTRERAVLLCNPWGQEYIRAHRSMRQLANMLSLAGFHVMRFDYFGTGDSAGEPTNVRLEEWEADIETAIDELVDITGLLRPSLLGLRLGASMAASVAARRRERLDALVMWDPVVSGEEYLAELRQADGVAVAHPTDSWEGGEVSGFPLTNLLLRDLQRVDLVDLVSRTPARALTIVSTPLPSHAALTTALSRTGRPPTSFETVASAPAWLEEENFGAGAVPVPLLRRIVEWLA